jgi:hypothetical protein
MHLPHRHRVEPQPAPEVIVEYTVRNSAGELLEWPCGCPRRFYAYESALQTCRSGDVVLRRVVQATPWSLA